MVARMSHALNGNFVLQHFKHGNAVELRNGIMFDLYLGLPHMHVRIESLRKATKQGRDNTTKLTPYHIMYAPFFETHHVVSACQVQAYSLMQF